MKNTSKITRSIKSKDSQYTCISNTILQSTTLTTDEKSVLVHILSLPETWVINKTTIWKQMNIGRERFYNAWKGLENQGHIVSKKITGERNLIVGYHHAVYEEALKSNSVTPVTGETENQLDQKPVNIESNKLQSNNLESNILKNNKSIANARSSTGPFSKNENLKSKIYSIAELQNDYMQISGELSQLKATIIKAAKMGTNVMSFVNKNDLPKLERAIGTNKFEQIKPLIEQYFNLDLICKQRWRMLNVANKSKMESQPNASE